MRFGTAPDPSDERKLSRKRPFNDALIEPVIVRHDEDRARARNVASDLVVGADDRAHPCDPPLFPPRLPLVDDRDAEAETREQGPEGGGDMAGPHDEARRLRLERFDQDVHRAATAHAELGAEPKMPGLGGPSASGSRAGAGRARFASATRTARSTEPPPTEPTQTPAADKKSFCPGVDGGRAVAREHRRHGARVPVANRVGGGLEHGGHVRGPGRRHHGGIVIGRELAARIVRRARRFEQNR